jgi:hypothetical protein
MQQKMPSEIAAVRADQIDHERSSASGWRKTGRVGGDWSKIANRLRQVAVTDSPKHPQSLGQPASDNQELNVWLAPTKKRVIASRPVSPNREMRTLQRPYVQAAGLVLATRELTF